eukprot:6806346-Alexandrium_andersonii.AAC.1
MCIRDSILLFFSPATPCQSRQPSPAVAASPRVIRIMNPCDGDAIPIARVARAAAVAATAA